MRDRARIQAGDLRPGDVYLRNGRWERVRWRQWPDRRWCGRLRRFYVRVRYTDVETGEYGEFTIGQRGLFHLPPETYRG